MAIPVLVVGLIVMLILLRVLATGEGVPSADDFSPTSFPSHPIVGYAARSGWWERLQIVLLAAVLAPIVEETMFRGVLYRHLREASARMRGPASAFLSATVVSFVFAAVHPQGLVAIPALMSLAYVLNLAREWRDTLIPGMVAHAINNAVLITVLLAALG
jgi:membrane protease YdiL (CAAX protease family)